MSSTTPRKRKASRRKPPPPPPRLVPWPVVVLAIDPGLTSGWALWAAGKYVDSGEVDALDPAAVARVVSGAMLTAELASMPAVLVYERSWSQRSLGPTRPIWKAAWKAGGGVQKYVVGFYPATWRARVLEKGMHAAPTDVVRRAEQRTAARIARRRVGVDEAPAVCMGQCGCHAGEVGAVLPQKIREAA